MRQTNQANVIVSRDGLSSVQPSFTHQVTVYCPACANGKAVNMNMFWQRNHPNRFQNIRCLWDICHKTIRVSKWHRRPHEEHNSIERWLKHNNAYNHEERHAEMTVDLYLTQDMSTEASLKRSAPVAATSPSHKRQKQ